MTLDKAIQDMLFNSSDNDLEWLANKGRNNIINQFTKIHRWTIAECQEFLDNASLAYELLVKDNTYVNNQPMYLQRMGIIQPI